MAVAVDRLDKTPERWTINGRCMRFARRVELDIYWIGRTWKGLGLEIGVGDL